MSVKIKRGFVYLADLNPKMGTEPGKIRPVLVLQTDLLNNVHPSTVVCPLTTNVQKKAQVLRVHLKKNQAGLSNDSDIMIDQMRAIDNRRFVKELGEVPRRILEGVYRDIGIVIDFPEMAVNL